MTEQNESQDVKIVIKQGGDMKGIIITEGRKALLKQLASGPKSWSALRLAYFGPERAKHSASTSFYNQLDRLMKANVIIKVAEGYALGEVGKKIIEADPTIVTGEFISKAGKNWPKEPAPDAGAFGQKPLVDHEAEHAEGCLCETCIAS